VVESILLIGTSIITKGALEHIPAGLNQGGFPNPGG
jgi:hypothetical protein